jgi:tetratricopeptide (TPR) repeat protein
LLAQRPAGLPDRHEIAGVPFYPQQMYQCGPAALATVLAHQGLAVTPESIAAAVYLPGREGSLQVEMLSGARREGRIAYVLAPRLEDVLREVAAGTPVVVLQNLTFSFAPLWHYAVVVGYDVAREKIVLRSGATQRLVMSLSVFERTWARSGYWAMVAVPPERLPVTAVEERYVDAAAAVERASPAAARRAYAAALERWPRNALALLGAGNAAYTLKDFAGAEQAYRHATAARPDSADAWNNLAQTLLELGRKEEAQAAVAEALELGGPRSATYRATLNAIEAAR